MNFEHNLCLWGFKCDEDEASLIDSELLEAHKKLQSSGRRRHHAEEAVIRLSGPLLPIIVPEDVRKAIMLLGLGVTTIDFCGIVILFVIFVSCCRLCVLTCS